jgi:hypothetical protein
MPTTSGAPFRVRRLLPSDGSRTQLASLLDTMRRSSTLDGSDGIASVEPNPSHATPSSPSVFPRQGSRPRAVPGHARSLVGRTVAQHGANNPYIISAGRVRISFISFDGSLTSVPCPFLLQMAKVQLVGVLGNYEETLAVGRELSSSPAGIPLPLVPQMLEAKLAFRALN